MTNFEYYKTKDNAIEAYNKETGEDIHHLLGYGIGTSPVKFLDWLYKERVVEQKEEQK